MMVDVDTAKHVELLVSSLNGKTRHSLFGVMNKCSTVNGTKQLRSNLFQPPIKVVFRSRYSLAHTTYI